MFLRTMNIKITIKKIKIIFDIKKKLSDEIQR